MGHLTALAPTRAQARARAPGGSRFASIEVCGAGSLCSLLLAAAGGTLLAAAAPAAPPEPGLPDLPVLERFSPPTAAAYAEVTTAAATSRRTTITSARKPGWTFALMRMTTASVTRCSAREGPGWCAARRCVVRSNRKESLARRRSRPRLVHAGKLRIRGRRHRRRRPGSDRRQTAAQGPAARERVDLPEAGRRPAGSHRRLAGPVAVLLDAPPPNRPGTIQRWPACRCPSRWSRPHRSGSPGALPSRRLYATRR